MGFAGLNPSYGLLKAYGAGRNVQPALSKVSGPVPAPFFSKCK
jgi:hypothetical protein